MRKFLLFSFAIIVAFGDELSPDELIAKARKALQNEDLKSALIHYAKACNSYDNGEACLHLGTLSYPLAPALSGKYLQKACDLGQKDACKFFDEEIKNFKISNEIRSKNKNLINMILMNQTLNDSEKQEWLNKLGTMQDEQKNMLFDILNTEVEGLEKIYLQADN